MYHSVTHVLFPELLLILHLYSSGKRLYVLVSFTLGTIERNKIIDNKTSYTLVDGRINTIISSLR